MGGRGLPAKYAKMGFKKGWIAYRKANKGRTTKRKVVGVKKVTRRRSYRRKRRRRAKSKAIPLAIAIPAGAPIIEAITRPEVKSAIDQGDPFGAVQSVMNVTSMRYTGYSTYDHTWDIKRAIPTWTGIAVGILIHKLAGKHINPHLKKIPLIGKYLAI